MGKTTTPELKKFVRFLLCSSHADEPRFMDKRVFIQLNGSRKVTGTLRGYDVFLNVVLDDAVEEKKSGEKEDIGQVVIRGNSVVMLEALDKV